MSEQQSWKKNVFQNEKKSVLFFKDAIFEEFILDVSMCTRVCVFMYIYDHAKMCVQ